MKRLTILILVMMGVALLPLSSQAILTTTDRATFIAAVPYTADVDISYLAEYSTLLAGTAVPLPDGKTLSFGDDLIRYQVPGSWSTWSGGNTPAVLYEDGLTVTGTFSSAIAAFGLEMEPNSRTGSFVMTYLLSDGTSLSQSVAGDGGAAFFGYFGGPTITGFTLSVASADALGFAEGRMIEGSCQPIPVPPSALLLGSGLLGLVGWRARKS